MPLALIVIKRKPKMDIQECLMAMDTTLTCLHFVRFFPSYLNVAGVNVSVA